MTFPINEFSELEIEQVSDVRLSDPNRYTRNRALGSKREYWLISVTNPPIPYSEGMKVGAKLASYRGSYEVFTLPNPFPALAVRSGVRLNAAALKNATTLQLKNLPNSNAIGAAGGDFLRIEGHAKAYQIIDDAASDAGGVATVSITPPLFQDVPENAVVYYGEDVDFQVCLNDVTSAKVNASNGKFMIFNFELMEQG